MGSAEVSRDTPPALLPLLLGDADAASPAAAAGAAATTTAEAASGCELALPAASAVVLPCTSEGDMTGLSEGPCSGTAP